MNMEKLKKIVNKYGFIFVFFIGMLLCFWKKDSYLQTTIVLNPDSQIVFSTENVLEQTWQPHVKKITEISIPYSASDTFKADLKLEVFSDDRTELLVTKIIEKEFVKDEHGFINFVFDELRVTLGERYRIQISFENAEMETYILVDSGRNYMGCSIDGQECNEAAAMNITFVKNSRIFWLFAIMFPVVSFSFLFMVLWERKWEEVIALAAIISIFPMYCLGLMEHLTGGIAVTYILAAAALVAAIYLYSKNEKDWRAFVSPGLIVWGILVVVILITCQGIWLARWDEYSHWGLAVKDMFYYDSFAKHYDTTVMLPRYVPFSTLAEYLYIYMNGLFSEDIIYVAFQIMLLNGIIIICHIANKKRRYIVPAVTAMIFVPIIFFRDVSSCIYVDPMLAIFAFYVLACYFGEKSSFFNWLRIFAGLFALVTTKDMGFAIAGLLTLIMMADTIYAQWRNRKLEVGKLVMPFCSLLGVVIFFMSWQIYLTIPYDIPMETDKMNEVQEINSGTTKKVQDSVEASGISIEGIKDFLTLKGEGYQYLSVKNYIVKLFDGDAYFIGNIGISCMDISIVLLVLTCLLGYIGVWGKWKYTMLSFGMFSFVASIVYYAFLELLYVFTFTQDEALTSASYERYIGSILCGEIITFIYILFQKLVETNDREKVAYGLALGLSAFIVIAVPFKNFVVTNREISVAEHMKYGFSDMEEVLRSFSKRGEKVYFVCNNSNGGSYFMFRNSASPLHVPYRKVNLAVSEERVQQYKEMYENLGATMKARSILTVEQWKEELKECDYVFVMITDWIFEQDYAEVFEDIETLDNGTFYKVVDNNGDISLSFIGQVPVRGYY